MITPNKNSAVQCNLYNEIILRELKNLQVIIKGAKKDLSPSHFPKVEQMTKYQWFFKFVHIEKLNHSNLCDKDDMSMLDLGDKLKKTRQAKCHKVFGNFNNFFILSFFIFFFTDFIKENLKD